MSKGNLGLLAAILIASGAHSAANAEDSGWHVGGGVGYYDVEPDFEEMAYQVYGGYTFNRYLAAEATYTYLAEDSIDGPFGGNVSLDGSAYALSLLPMLSFGNGFALFARLGWAVYDAEASGFGVTASDSDDDAYWGAGMQYRMSNAWEVRGEVTFLGDDTDDRMGMLSANYRF